MLNDLLAFDGKHVDLGTLKTVKGYLRKINRANIEDIVWMQDGEIITCGNISVADWKFMGINNTDIAALVELRD
jgi:hypothetical protein